MGKTVLIIIMYIYHALIRALTAHIIHINLNTIFYTHVEDSLTKTIYIRHYMHARAHTHTHTHARTHARTHANKQTHARTRAHTHTHTYTQYIYILVRMEIL